MSPSGRISAGLAFVNHFGFNSDKRFCKSSLKNSKKFIEFESRTHRSMTFLHSQHFTRCPHPCISVILSDPALKKHLMLIFFLSSYLPCSPSTFWVISQWNRSDLSQAANAWWVGLGRASRNRGQAKKFLAQNLKRKIPLDYREILEKSSNSIEQMCNFPFAQLNRMSF